MVALHFLAVVLSFNFLMASASERIEDIGLHYSFQKAIQEENFDEMSGDVGKGVDLDQVETTFSLSPSYLMHAIRYYRSGSFSFLLKNGANVNLNVWNHRANPFVLIGEPNVVARIPNPSQPYPSTVFIYVREKDGYLVSGDGAKYFLVSKDGFSSVDQLIDALRSGAEFTADRSTFFLRSNSETALDYYLRTQRQVDRLLDQYEGSDKEWVEAHPETIDALMDVYSASELASTLGIAKSYWIRDVRPLKGSEVVVGDDEKRPVVKVPRGVILAARREAVVRSIRYRQANLLKIRDLLISNGAKSGVSDKEYSEYLAKNPLVNVRYENGRFVAAE